MGSEAYTACVDTFIDSLPGNLVLTKISTRQGDLLPVEAMRIEEVEKIHGQYIYHRLSSQRNELFLKASAKCYYLTASNTVEKYNIDSLTLDLNSTEIIPVTNDNIISLLIDSNALVRKAAEEWYIEHTKDHVSA